MVDWGGLGGCGLGAPAGWFVLPLPGPASHIPRPCVPVRPLILKVAVLAGLALSADKQALASSLTFGTLI